MRVVSFLIKPLSEADHGDNEEEEGKEEGKVQVLRSGSCRE